jgi:hypothetical protein
MLLQIPFKVVDRSHVIVPEGALEAVKTTEPPGQKLGPPTGKVMVCENINKEHSVLIRVKSTFRILQILIYL